MLFLRSCIVLCLLMCLMPDYAQSLPPKKIQTQSAKKTPAKKPAVSSSAPRKSHAPPKKTSPSRTVTVKKTVPKAAPAKPTPANTLPALPIPSQPVLPQPAAPAAKITPAPPSQSVPSVVPKVTHAVPTPTMMQKAQRLIVIDPGHGGYDLGARRSACDEKSLALSTALLTKKYLTEMGYRVILTRSRDVFIPLEKRALIANETKSKLFVSIHYNSAKNPLAKGVEVFYYTSADKFRTGSSKKLATRVLNKIIDRTVAESRGIKAGNFHVLRETKMPAILVEAGFMTHPEELHHLKDITYREKIARGIAEGVDSFFKV